MKKLMTFVLCTLLTMGTLSTAWAATPRYSNTGEIYYYKGADIDTSRENDLISGYISDWVISDSYYTDEEICQMAPDEDNFSYKAEEVLF